MLQRETIELVIQVNGKVRDRLTVPAGLPEDELVALAKGSERVRAYLDGTSRARSSSPTSSSTSSSSVRPLGGASAIACPYACGRWRTS